MPSRACAEHRVSRVVAGLSSAYREAPRQVRVAGYVYGPLREWAPSLVPSSLWRAAGELATGRER